MRHGDHIKLLLPAARLSCLDVQGTSGHMEVRLDMQGCATEPTQDNWGTRLLFRKLGEECSRGFIQPGDAVSIFSAENGLRLDAAEATCEGEHDSWASMFEVRVLEEGATLMYNVEMGLFSKEDGRRLDIGSACGDTSHVATQFEVQRVAASPGMEGLEHSGATQGFEVTRAS